MPKQTVIVYLDPEDKKKLQAWSKREGRSVSNLAGRLLTKAIRHRRG